MLSPLLGLAACGSLLSAGASDVAGVAGAGVAGAVSANAATAAAIGLGTQSLASEGVRYLQRRVHRTEQDAIAAVAGNLPLNTIAPWSVSHSLPLEDDARGQVVVSRTIGNGVFRCKEIVFSVETTEKRQPVRRFYVSTVCKSGDTWKWASAEPSVARWGGLQ